MKVTGSAPEGCDAAAIRALPCGGGHRSDCDVAVFLEGYEREADRPRLERVPALASRLLKSGYPKPAAREASQSVLRAGRAFVSEQSDKAPKTHKGTVALFSDIAVRWTH